MALVETTILSMTDQLPGLALQLPPTRQHPPMTRPQLPPHHTPQVLLLLQQQTHPRPIHMAMDKRVESLVQATRVSTRIHSPPTVLASLSQVPLQVPQVRLMTLQPPPVSNPVWREKLKGVRSRIPQGHTIPWAPTSLFPNRVHTLAALPILPDPTLQTSPIVPTLALTPIVMDTKVLVQVPPVQALV